MKRFLLACAVSLISIPITAAENEDKTLQIYEALRDINALRPLIANKKDADRILFISLMARNIDVEIILFLLKEGANPNDPRLKNLNQSLLGIAVSQCCSYVNSIPQLIALGVDPNFPNRQGETPLHICMPYIEGTEKDISECKYFQEIQTLLQHGANPLLKNNKGKTPRESICEHRRKAYPIECEKVAAVLHREEKRWMERIRMNLHGTPRPAHRRVKILKRPSTQEYHLLENPPQNGKLED